MPLAYLRSDATFTYTRWNAAAERLFGWRETEALGKHPFDLIVPPEAQPYVAAVFDRLRRGEALVTGANANRTRTGRTVFCEWTNTPLYDPDGAFAGIVSLAQDVTDRLRMEEALRASEERYRTIVEAAHEGIWALDAAGRTTFVNHRLTELLGAPAAALFGRPLLDFVPAADRDAVRADLARHRAAPGVQEIRLCRQDGAILHALVSATPLPSPTGRPAGTLLMVTDVTERRRLEAQFRQAQKMEAIGRLAGGVAHDFNNLLTVINGYSELLLAGPAAGPQRPALEEIHKAGARAALLTRQLLAFSRQAVLEPRVLDLNAVVRESERLIRRLVGEDVAVHAHLALDLGQVRADPGQLHQVILNLVVNARDAMPTGGRLELTTANVELCPGRPPEPDAARGGPFVLLAVSDTGCGMTPEVLARICEPFFTTKPVGQGTGLGLATVYGIVRQSDGHLAVASAPGRGTTFKVYLPRVGWEEPRPADGEPAAALPRGGETILLVEDEAPVRRYAAQVLEGLGYRVLTAADGAEARAVTAAHPEPLDLLVTDVVMPHQSGRQLAEALQAQRPGLKVLFMSGYTEDAVVRHGVRSAEAAILHKPFSPAALAHQVRQILDGLA
jgi:PAS domain S-box-containing protein